jgi:hypothetical protein
MTRKTKAPAPGALAQCLRGLTKDEGGEIGQSSLIVQTLLRDDSSVAMPLTYLVLRRLVGAQWGWAFPRLALAPPQGPKARRAGEEVIHVDLLVRGFVD